MKLNDIFLIYALKILQILHHRTIDMFILNGFHINIIINYKGNQKDLAIFYIMWKEVTTDMSESHVRKAVETDALLLTHVGALCTHISHISSRRHGSVKATCSGSSAL